MPSIGESVIIYSAFATAVQVRMYFWQWLVIYASCEFTLQKICNMQGQFLYSPAILLS